MVDEVENANRGILSHNIKGVHSYATINAIIKRENFAAHSNNLKLNLLNMGETSYLPISSNAVELDGSDETPYHKNINIIYCKLHLPVKC